MNESNFRHKLTKWQSEKVEDDVENEDLPPGIRNGNGSSEQSQEGEYPRRRSPDALSDVPQMTGEHFGRVEPTDWEHAKPEAKVEDDQHDHSSPSGGLRSEADTNGEARHSNK